MNKERSGMKDIARRERNYCNKKEKEKHKGKEGQLRYRHTEKRASN